MELDLEQPLSTLALYYTCQDSMFEDASYIFDIESQHMPSNTINIDRSFRKQAISCIMNLSSHGDLDPFLSYLAINYLDRFLCTQPIQDGKPWIFKLLAVSCVSLALKISKTEVYVTNIQHDGKSIFDKQTIGRMELLILGALKWRMRPITPLSFINFFASFFEVQDLPLRRALTARATEIIFKSQCELEILELRPSVVAASAVLYAAHQLFPLQFSCLEKAIFTCCYIDKINLEKCNTIMQDIATKENNSVFDTPMNVLNQQQWSSCSGLTRTGSVEMRDCKRRKVDSHGSDQIQQC
ncbi:CYCLIN domain-containing protein [Heracleum sosnowskyi]|uniref:CYCLIN domain-containing protein n=1 Tax=Heracleum sosnowskyi TaxID=360622 RepID=A0AAD8IYR3_9APIA|nr:CYCLIN domain-containing protein [Heracleum sosnowskyi]